MRTVLLANSSSGRGGRGALLDAIASAISGAGHEVTRLTVSARVGAELDAALAGASALLIAGGDGTVHYALPHAIEHDVPVYHIPLGTENLFAREFGRVLDPVEIGRIAVGGRFRRIDVGTVRCGGGPARPFALMVSVGPDAGVIERLHRTRKGSISHLAYVKPLLAESLRPWLPRMTVRVDGRVVVEGARGLVVVANSRQYAMRADPAYAADVSDGRLDVAFMPASSGVGGLWWLINARLRRHMRDGAFVGARGTAIEIEVDDPRGVFQVDGEHAAGPAPLRLHIEVAPQKLKVLVPSEA